MSIFSHLEWGWTGDDCFPHPPILFHMLTHFQHQLISSITHSLHFFQVLVTFWVFTVLRISAFFNSFISSSNTRTPSLENTLRNMLRNQMATSSLFLKERKHISLLWLSIPAINMKSLLIKRVLVVEISQKISHPLLTRKRKLMTSQTKNQRTGTRGRRYQIQMQKSQKTGMRMLQLRYQIQMPRYQ